MQDLLQKISLARKMREFVRNAVRETLWGANLFGGDSGTVDNCRPNALGLYCMAKAPEPMLKAVL